MVIGRIVPRNNTRLVGMSGTATVTAAARSSSGPVPGCITGVPNPVSCVALVTAGAASATGPSGASGTSTSTSNLSTNRSSETAYVFAHSLEVRYGWQGR